MTTFEEMMRNEARLLAVAAYNRARGWIDHPSYNTKGDVLKGFDDAEAVLCTVEAVRDRAATAEGAPTGRPGTVAGVDRRALREVRAMVKDRRGSERLVLPPLTAVVFGGHLDDARPDADAAAL